MATSISSGPTAERTSNARWTIAWVLAALLVPVMALGWAGYWQVGHWPAAAAPFGFVELLVAHALAGLPLSLLLAWTVARQFFRQPTEPPRGRMGTLALAMGGLILACVAIVVAVPLRDALVGSGWSRAEAWPVRIIWLLVLQLPWAIGATRSLGAVAASWRPRSLDLATALLLTVAPLQYQETLVSRQSQLVAHALVNQQYVLAERLARPVRLLGTGPLVGYDDCGQLLADLRSAIAQLEPIVARPLPPEATAEARLQRAFELFQLGRFQAMRRVLGDLPARLPEATFRLALASELEGNWGEAARLYERTLELLEKRGAQTPNDRKLLRSAFERLANNLRRVGEQREAEQVLRGAIDKWPQERPALLLQLALHYRMAGRILEAMDAFKAALAADPSLEPIVRANLQQLQDQAEGCLLRPAQAATR